MLLEWRFWLLGEALPHLLAPHSLVCVCLYLLLPLAHASPPPPPSSCSGRHCMGVPGASAEHLCVPVS